MSLAFSKPECTHTHTYIYIYVCTAVPRAPFSDMCLDYHTLPVYSYSTQHRTMLKHAPKKISLICVAFSISAFLFPFPFPLFPFLSPILSYYPTTSLPISLHSQNYRVLLLQSSVQTIDLPAASCARDRPFCCGELGYGGLFTCLGWVGKEQRMNEKERRKGGREGGKKREHEESMRRVVKGIR